MKSSYSQSQVASDALSNNNRPCHTTQQLHNAYHKHNILKTFNAFLKSHALTRAWGLWIMSFFSATMKSALRGLKDIERVLTTITWHTHLTRLYSTTRLLYTCAVEVMRQKSRLVFLKPLNWLVAVIQQTLCTEYTSDPLLSLLKLFRTIKWGLSSHK